MKLNVRALELGLSQKVIAGRLGVSRPTLSRWLRGSYPVPSDHVLLLAEILKLPASVVAKSGSKRNKTKRQPSTEKAHAV